MLFSELFMLKNLLDPAPKTEVAKNDKMVNQSDY